MTNSFVELEVAATKYLNSLSLGTTDLLTMRELEAAREWFRSKGWKASVSKINELLRTRVLDAMNLQHTRIMRERS